MFRPRSIGLLLALVTLLIYLPAASDDFINFDDPIYVTANPVVQNGLTWAGVKWAFTGAHADNWHPLTWVSHMLDCDLFRRNAGGPHLVNVLFHAANAALLFALVFRLTGKQWPSAMVAALFAWHPQHVESVAWVAERKDVLSTFFALLTLLSYARYAELKLLAAPYSSSNEPTPSTAIRSPSRYYSLTAIFFVLALLSKPMPVTLPVVMLLLDFWPLRRVAGGAWQPEKICWLVLEKVPFFLLTATSCVVTFLAQRNEAVSSLARFPLNYRLENVVTAYVGYLGKMIWPLHLAIFYPFAFPFSAQWVATAVFILAGVSVIVWRRRQTSPWLIVGWLWYLITLVPVIGLVQVGGQSLADRYTYFPLIGIFMALTFSASALAEHFVLVKKWLATAAALMLAACVVLTEKQLSYWHDSETLFTHALTVAESDLAYCSLGAAYQQQNRLPEAMQQYILATKFAPESPIAYDDLGRLLDDEGKPEAAASYYRQAVRWNPRSAAVHDNLGIILVELGRLDEALGEFTAAAQLAPGDPHPPFTMGRILLQQGRDAEAVTRLRAALRLDPNNPQMLIFTASVLAADENPRGRDGAAALALATQAVQLTQGKEPAVLDAQAMAFAETGQFTAAELAEQQAIKSLQATGQTDDVPLMQKHLQSYQAHQPWRESFKKSDSAH